MARYRHWKNHGLEADCVFVSATCLDFAHLFSSDAQKDLLASSLIEGCMDYKAELHAYVVMSNHFHLLCNTPPSMTASDLMRQLKSRSARLIKPHLSESQIEALKQQEGLNDRTFWQRGYRGVRVFSASAFDVKARYIALNPVRAGICKEPEEYRWSSVFAIANGAHDEFNQLDSEKALRLYK